MQVTRRARGPVEAAAVLQLVQIRCHLLKNPGERCKGGGLPGLRRPCNHIGHMLWPPLAVFPFVSGAAGRRGTIGRAASGQDRLVRRWWRLGLCLFGSEP